MANPLYTQLGGGGQGDPMPMFQQFQRFMQQNKGIDPNQKINEIVSSGMLNQNQLNMVQQRKQQLEGQFNQFKSMFGF